GAGALLGQGILRLLQISDFSKKIFTADPDIRSTGHWLGDYAITIPKATEENYISTIKKIVVEHKIDAILVGTDVELPILSQYKNEFLKDFNCKIIVSNKEVIDISNDKFLTAKFLEKNNFPFPFSVMANDKEKLSLIEKKLGFPLFAKPYDGARSLGILKIDNHEQLLSIYCENSNLVVQQFLPETDGEFTSGCVVIGGKCKAIVTLKRDLRDGNTYRAYVDKDTSKYDSYIIAIAEKLNADGPVNFQFRIVDDKPIVFEINGRFSGTTPIRHFFGFNEVEAILKYELFGIEIEKTALKNGIVLRACSDIFI
ncbi:ATP-grasp domain-containing protein, partial [Tenacibaculum finnmarkense]|uniref:ATP-grasp domain-containing protein n=1 Tax=Tenacibaculum finnmarkense TaxID=2781243 RepID=UPI00187B44E1